MPFARTAPTPSRIVTRLAQVARRAVDRQEEPLAEDEVDLGRLGPRRGTQRRTARCGPCRRTSRPSPARCARRCPRRSAGGGRGPRRRPDAARSGSIRSTQSRVSGSATIAGQRGDVDRLASTPDGDQRRSDRPDARPSRAGASGPQRAIVGRRSSRPSGSSAFPPTAERRCARDRRQHTRAAGRRARPGGIATIVTTPATTNSPMRICDASPAAQRSSASTTNASRSGRSRSSAGMTCLPAVGHREQLVVEAIDRRRAVGGQDRHADRHADHPGDGDDRARHAERRPAGRLDRRGRARRDGQAEAQRRRPPARARPRRDRRAGVQRAIQTSAPALRRQPDERHEPQRQVADREPRHERPDGRRRRRAPRARPAAARGRRRGRGRRTPPRR